MILFSITGPTLSAMKLPVNTASTDGFNPVDTEIFFTVHIINSNGYLYVTQRLIIRVTTKS